MHRPTNIVTRKGPCFYVSDHPPNPSGSTDAAGILDSSRRLRLQLYHRCAAIPAQAAEAQKVAYVACFRGGRHQKVSKLHTRLRKAIMSEPLPHSGTCSTALDSTLRPQSSRTFTPQSSQLRPGQHQTLGPCLPCSHAVHFSLLRQMYYSQR